MGMSKSHEILYNNFATLFDAGIPLMRVLDSAGQGSSSKIRGMLKNVNEYIHQGNGLADSMEKASSYFAHLDIVAIRAAEDSGSLAEVFKMLSEWYSLKHKVKMQIRSGLVLPFMIITIAAVLAPLPLYFLGTYTLGQMIRESLFILSLFYVPTIAIFLLLKHLPDTGNFRYILDSVGLRIPVLSKAIKHLAISRYCTVFHLLSKAAMPIDACAKYATQATTNAVIADKFRGGETSANNGEPVSTGFKKNIGMGVVESWKMGEESGQLDVVTKKLADQNAEEALFCFERFSYWLPKLIYFLVLAYMATLVIRNASQIYAPIMEF